LLSRSVELFDIEHAEWAEAVLVQNRLEDIYNKENGKRCDGKCVRDNNHATFIVDLETYRTGTRKISFYSPYWLINLTKLPFQFIQSSGDSEKSHGSDEHVFVSLSRNELPYCPWLMKKIWGKDEETGLEVTEYENLVQLSQSFTRYPTLTVKEFKDYEYSSTSIYPIPYAYRENIDSKNNKTAFAVVTPRNKLSSRSDFLNFDTTNISQTVKVKDDKEVYPLNITSLLAKPPFSKTTVVLIGSRWFFYSKFKNRTILVRQYVQNSEELSEIKNTNVRLQSKQSKKYIEFSRAFAQTTISSEVKKKKVEKSLPYIELKPNGTLTSWKWTDSSEDSYDKKVVQFSIQPKDFRSQGDYSDEKYDYDWSGPVGIGAVGEYTLFVKDPRREDYAHMVRIIIREHPQTKGFLVSVLPEAQTRPQYVVSNKTECEMVLIQAETQFAGMLPVVIPPFTSVPYGLFNCLSKRSMKAVFKVKKGDKYEKLEKEYAIDSIDVCDTFEITSVRKEKVSETLNQSAAFTGVSGSVEETVYLEVSPSSYAVGGQLYLEFSQTGYTSMYSEYKKRLKQKELQEGRSVINKLTEKLRKKRRIERAGELAVSKIAEETKKLENITDV
jgi:hypothetical protein